MWEGKYPQKESYVGTLRRHLKRYALSVTLGGRSVIENQKYQKKYKKSSVSKVSKSNGIK